MTDRLDLDDGLGAPPRANGELIFTAPWQSRLFATTMTLRDRQIIEWETFRQGLISQIGAHETTLADSADFDYWGCWQRALETVLADAELVPTDDLQAASKVIADRPPDH